MKIATINELQQIKVLGRIARRTQPQPLFWAASGLDFVFSGSELWVQFDAYFDCQEPWICVEVNGAWIMRMPILEKGQWVCLLRNLTPGVEKRVRIFKDCQAMNGDRAHLLNVVALKWEGGEILPPPSANLKIEFVGDSLTSGEGTIGAVQETDWVTAFFSSMPCFTKKTADLVNAEFRTISQGGWGIAAGWDNDPSTVIVDIYDKVCACAKSEEAILLGAGEQASVLDWKADVVVINLGTNDYSAFCHEAWVDPYTGESYKLRRDDKGGFVPEDAALIRREMGKLLRKIRNLHPTAKLVWCYGMLPGELAPLIQQGLAQYQAETGDDCAFLRLTEVTMQTMGARWHPGAECHTQAAQLLAKWIRDNL